MIELIQTAIAIYLAASVVFATYMWIVTGRYVEEPDPFYRHLDKLFFVGITWPAMVYAIFIADDDEWNDNDF